MYFRTQLFSTTDFTQLTDVFADSTVSADVDFSVPGIDMLAGKPTNAGPGDDLIIVTEAGGGPIDGEGGYDTVRLVSDTFFGFSFNTNVADPSADTWTLFSNGGNYSIVNVERYERVGATSGNVEQLVLFGDAAGNVLDASSETGTFTLIGGAGNDTLTGSTLGGQGSLHGGTGNDTLIGGSGNTEFNGGTGADTMVGGVGVDTLYYLGSSFSSQSGVTINLGTGAASGGEATGDTFSDIENVWGSLSHDDHITGDAGNNDLRGFGGNDTLIGGAGNDLIYGGDGNDTIYTGLGSDSAYGEAGDDVLVGADEFDFLDGGDGVDILYGRDGGDTLYGGAGNDTLNGEAGNDFLIGGAGADILNGGTGQDTIDYASSATAVDVNLAVNVGLGGDAAGDTFYGIENVNGSAFDDVIVGNSAINNLRGGAGNDDISAGDGVDRLVGGDGDDTLDGGADDDVLIGGLGMDTMTGGAGNDVFAARESYDTTNVSFYFADDRSNFNGDTITDFQIGDVIEFSAVYTETVGDLDFISNGAGGGSLDLGDGSILNFTTIAAGTDFVTIDDLMGPNELVLVDSAGLVRTITQDRHEFITDVETANITVNAGVHLGADMSGGLFGPNYQGGQIRLNGGQDHTFTNNGETSYVYIESVQSHVINNNLISGRNHGVFVANHTATSGSNVVIDNASGATIFGPGYGLSIAGAQDYGDNFASIEDATINNDGLIEANFSAIRASAEQNLTINNTGTIRNVDSTTSGVNDGQGISASSIFTTINNSGVIEVVSTQGGFSIPTEGVAIFGGSLNSEIVTINNSGRISSTGDVIRMGGASDENTENYIVINNTATGIMEADTNNNDTEAYVVLTSGPYILQNLPGLNLFAGNSDVEEMASFDITNDGLMDGSISLYEAAHFELTARPFQNYNTQLFELHVPGVDNPIVQDTDINGDGVFDGNGDPVFSSGTIFSDYFGTISYTMSGGVANFLDAGGCKIYMFPDYEDTQNGVFDDVIMNSGTIDGDVNTGMGDDLVDLGASGDVKGYVNGGLGDDVLNGSSLANRFFGGTGDDTINGRGGNDTIIGWSGVDTAVLNGGAFTDYSITDNGDGSFLITDNVGTDGVDYVDGVEFLELAGGGVLELGTVLDGTANSYTGTANNDIVHGLGDDDTLSGGNGDDSLLGGDGEDTLHGQNGNDTLIGGAGNDLLSGAVGDDWLDGGDGNDIIYTGNGQNTAYGGAGTDTIIGGGGCDYLFGGADNDILNGAAGNDALLGGDGNDSLSGGYGFDTLSGGEGNDLLSGGDGNDALYGGEGTDSLYGGVGDDFLDGGDGDDTIIAESGDDLIYGGSGLDTIYAGTGVNTVYGGDDADTIVGGNDLDTIFGDDGNDVVYAQGGNDTINGGLGNDFVAGGAGADTVDGGEGSDTISGGADNDVVNGGYGTDLIYGGAGNDSLDGDEGNDTIFAGSGDDFLLGGDGNDKLYAQAGINILSGDAGDDNYYGGSGADTMVFYAEDGPQLDRVSFFDTSDTVDLRGFGFATAADSHTSFAQSSGNVIFNSGGVQIVFYGATLADVQSAVIVDGLAEQPGVDKSVVAEDLGATDLDVIANFLSTDLGLRDVEGFDEGMDGLDFGYDGDFDGDFYAL